MCDAARDPAALELLRVQRSRLADRMRWPWWYVTGVAIVWALAFAAPFRSRYFPQVRIWPFLLTVVALAWLLQWGLARATGMEVGTRMFRYPSGRPAEIAIIVVGAAALVTEFFLVRHGPLASAIAVAALAVTAELACQQALLRGIRRDLRGGGGPT